MSSEGNDSSQYTSPSDGDGEDAIGSMVKTSNRQSPLSVSIYAVISTTQRTTDVS